MKTLFNLRALCEHRFAAASLAGALSIGGLSGCASTSGQINMDTCVAVAAQNLSLPFIGISKTQGAMDFACATGKNLAGAALIGRAPNGDINPVAAQLVTKQVNEFHRKITAGENSDYNERVLSFFAAYLAIYKTSYDHIKNAAEPPKPPCAPDKSRPTIMICQSSAPQMGAPAISNSASAPQP